MAENFRAWFMRTRGLTFPGVRGESQDATLDRALDAMAEWADVVAQRAASAPPQPLLEVQVCRVENHIIPGRAADLRVIADDPESRGDYALQRWVQDRLNGPSPKAAVAEKPKSEPAHTRMFVIACRDHAYYVIGPFADREALRVWAHNEDQFGQDRRWHIMELPEPGPYDHGRPVPAFLSASQHPPRD